MNKIDNHINLAALLHPRNHSANHPMKFMSQPDFFSPKNDVALHSNAAVGTKSLYQAISRQFSSRGQEKLTLLIQSLHIVSIDPFP